LADNNNIKSQNNDDKNRHVSSVKIPAKIRQDAKKDIKRMMQERESRLRKYNLLLLKKQQLLNELLKLRERAKIEESLANQELLKKQIQEFEMKLKVLEDQINEEKVYVEDKNDNGLSSELETEKNVEQKQQEINNSENESAKQNTNENTTLSAKDRFDILLKNINENNKSNSQQDSEELPKSNLNPASNIEQTVVDSKLTSQVSEDNIVNQQKMEVSEQHIKEERPYNDLRPNNDLVNNKFIYEVQNNISYEQKLEWINKFYKRMSTALYKWSILPPATIIEPYSINKHDYLQPITSTKINYEGIDAELN